MTTSNLSPSTAEEALDIVDTLVRSGAVDAVVLDSVAALVPRAELEGTIGEQIIGPKHGLCPKHYES